MTNRVLADRPWKPAGTNSGTISKKTALANISKWVRSIGGVFRATLARRLP